MAVNDPMVDGLLEVGRRMRKCSDFEGRMRHVVNAVHAALMVSDDRFAFTEEQRDQLSPEVTCRWLKQAFPDLIAAHVDHFRPGEQRKVQPADDERWPAYLVHDGNFYRKHGLPSDVVAGVEYLAVVQPDIGSMLYEPISSLPADTDAPVWDPMTGLMGKAAAPEPTAEDASKPAAKPRKRKAAT